MWVRDNISCFDIRLVNWLLGRPGTLTDQVSHEALVWIASQVANKQSSHAMIDAQGVHGGQHEVYESFLARCAVSPKYPTRICFFNVSADLRERIEREAKVSNAWIANVGKGVIVFSRVGHKRVSRGDLDPAKLCAVSDDILRDTISLACRKCCVTTKTLSPLPSSPVETNVRFDCKRLVSSARDCAPMVRELGNYVSGVEARKGKMLTLCASSVNGAILAKYIASYLNRACLVLNHLGPKDKLFEKRVLGFIRSGVSYLMVTDYACLGTELRVARSNIENHGGVYAGAVSLGALSRAVAGHPSLGDLHSLVYIADIARNVRVEVPGLRRGHV